MVNLHVVAYSAQNGRDCFFDLRTENVPVDEISAVELDESKDPASEALSVVSVNET